MSLLFREINPEGVFTFMIEEDTPGMLTFLLEQMSTKRGIKQFGTAGKEAIMNELKQLIYCKMMEGCHANKGTMAQKKDALHYLMYLKREHCG